MCCFPTSEASPTLTESLGAQGTVTLLNDYFTLMVECIQAEGGMLDKFMRRRHHGRVRHPL